jgi:hypothetical protein
MRCRQRELKLLRAAFMATMKDPEFLADTQRVKLDVNPKKGRRFAHRASGDLAQSAGGRFAGRSSTISPRSCDARRTADGRGGCP